MAKAAHGSPRLRKMASLAKTLKEMPHKADGGGIDEDVDVRSKEEMPTSVGPYGLGAAMQYERSKADHAEAAQGKRFMDYGSRIPGSQKAKNDAYTARLKKRD